MTNYLRNFTVLFFISTLLGCSLVDLKIPRTDDNNNENREKVNELSKLRAANVAENETFFTNQLRCIGDGISPKKWLEQSLGNIVSVAPIYDKTTKVFPAGSTAISDMVINALSYVKHIYVVETPLSGDILESRTNLLSTGYLIAPELKKIIPTVASRMSALSFGVLFPSNFYITGALVEYDEGSELLSPAMKVDANIFSGRRQVDVITVGLHLRLINSADGQIQSNSSKNKRGSLLYLNKFYKISLDNSLFKLISFKPYGLDYSVTVADPKHYAIQEMVEKGVAELLSVLPNENDCSI